MAGIQYTIGMNRLKKALFEGMTPDGQGKIGVDEGDVHTMCLPMLDCGMEDCAWGRLKMELEREADTVVVLYLLASNERGYDAWFCDPGLGFGQKKKRLLEAGGIRVINQSDMLLYELTGRYFWLLLEVVGAGARISGMVLQAPGDNFMATFPEVYREKNSFFHRYLSVFSSMYNDFQEQIDRREELLDIERAPEERLILYAGWLGLHLHPGYLPVEVLRTLVREAGSLSRCKGTRACIERICQIVLGETPRIVERSLLQRYVNAGERERIDALYGDGPYDVTLMLENPIDEKRQKQLLLLLDQFKPIRSRLGIVYLGESGVLDAHTYLDQNAVTFVQEDGVLDDGQPSDGTIVLQS